jgi:hypothetical protein
MKFLALKKGIFLLILSLFTLNINLEASWFSFSNLVADQTLSQKFFESAQQCYSSVWNFIRMHPVYTGLGVLGIASLWYMTRTKLEQYDIFGKKVDNVKNYEFVEDDVNHYLQDYVVTHRQLSRGISSDLVVITTFLSPRKEDSRSDKFEGFYVDARKFKVIGTEEISLTQGNELTLKQTIKLQPISAVQNSYQNMQIPSRNKAKIRKTKKDKRKVKENGHSDHDDNKCNVQ